MGFVPLLVGVGGCWWVLVGVGGLLYCVYNGQWAMGNGRDYHLSLYYYLFCVCLSAAVCTASSRSIVAIRHPTTRDATHQPAPINQ